MHDTYRLRVRRIDGRWHVAATAWEDRTEHTHCKSFTDKRKAYGLRDRIELALAYGRDLNLAHWSAESFG